MTFYNHGRFLFLKFFLNKGRGRTQSRGRSNSHGKYNYHNHHRGKRTAFPGEASSEETDVNHAVQVFFFLLLLGFASAGTQYLTE